MLTTHNLRNTRLLAVTTTMLTTGVAVAGACRSRAGTARCSSLAIKVAIVSGASCVGRRDTGARSSDAGNRDAVVIPPRRGLVGDTIGVMTRPSSALRLDSRRGRLAEHGNHRVELD